jgi:hypothetical protein
MNLTIHIPAWLIWSLVVSVAPVHDLPRLFVRGHPRDIPLRPLADFQAA